MYMKMYELFVSVGMWIECVIWIHKILKMLMFLYCCQFS